MAKERNKPEGAFSDEVLAEWILDALRGIKYGYVQITVHDSKVVHIEKTERFRMCRSKGGDS